MLRKQTRINEVQAQSNDAFLQVLLFPLGIKVLKLGEIHKKGIINKRFYLLTLTNYKGSDNDKRTELNSSD